MENRTQLYIVGQGPESGSQCLERKVHCSWLSDLPAYKQINDKIYLASEYGIYIRGRVANLDNVLCKARVLLSPINVGTGVNTKSFLSFTYGLPLLATSKGLAGITADLDLELPHEENAADFAAAANKLHNNKNEWIAARSLILDVSKKVQDDNVLLRDLKLLYSRLGATTVA